MRIACLGGGPAGLYFAISMKLREPGHEVHLFERNRADDTFGWGVVFSDQTVEHLLANDSVSGAPIRSERAHWHALAATPAPAARSGGGSSSRTRPSRTASRTTPFPERRSGASSPIGTTSTCTCGAR